MTLTSQRPRTLPAVRQRHATLLLDIHRALRLGHLGLLLVLLLLLLGLLVLILVIPGLGLALLPFLRRPFLAPHALGALLRALLPLHRILAVLLPRPVGASASTGLLILSPTTFLLLLGPVRRIARLLLLARPLLLRLQTVLDVLYRDVLERRLLAVLAHDGFEVVFLARAAGWERG